jgi:hypothetical protein
LSSSQRVSDGTVLVVTAMIVGVPNGCDQMDTKAVVESQMIAMKVAFALTPWQLKND